MMHRYSLSVVAAALGVVTLGLTAPTQAVAKPLLYTGLSIAGGDFGSVSPGNLGVYGKDYVYPSDDEIKYFSSKGMDLMRLPVFWERIQPRASAPLDKNEMDRLAAPIREAARRHMVVVLDIHNYDRYYGQVVGQGDTTSADFADLWSRLATTYKSNQRVWFGLSNEPHDEPTELWVAHANAAIAAIRKAGAHNLVLVGGNAWSGAYHWYEAWYGTPNATALLAIVDPQNNYAFECHAYLDPDNAGKTDAVASPTVGMDRVKIFGDWCRDNHKRGFLGEFGAGGTPESAEATNNMLTYMEANPDVWIGWACWAGGSMWGDNVLSIEPSDGKDKPQMAFLIPHLHRKGRVPANPPSVAFAPATAPPVGSGSVTSPSPAIKL